MHPYFERHDEHCVLLPTLSISRGECDCGCSGLYVLGIDFLIFTAGICWEG